MNDPNLDQLITAARALRPLLGELVFVGGSVTGLLITDPAAGEPRPTIDVDAIATCTTYAQYVKLGARLRALGFVEDSTEGAPLCRYRRGTTILDVMPLDPHILGFSNRWYRTAVTSAETYRLGDDLTIRIVSAPLFLTTKIEAFKSRGEADFFGSRDLEDLVFLVDGRDSLVEEARNESADVRAYISAEVAALLSAPGFLDALLGYLRPDAASQSRMTIVLERLRELARI